VPVRSGWWPLGGSDVTLPAVQVRPIERTTRLPAVAHPIEANLGDAVDLLGYDGDVSAVRAGDTISLTLYWQPTGALPTSHKATVQLTTSDNQVVGQQDSVPANWTRPTTGWLPGEVVADPHAVPIPPETPPGKYSLIAALYDEASGQRLIVRQTGEERDHVVLSSVEIRP
jgi:hypothetical protein